MLIKSWGPWGPWYQLLKGPQVDYWWALRGERKCCWKLEEKRPLLYNRRKFFSTLSSVQFSRSFRSNSLWPHGLQHARPPCPSPTPGVYPNSCPVSWWCHPTTSSSVVPFSSHLQPFPASGSFPKSVLHIRWPKYWSFTFSISPSNEYSELISFRMDWFDPLAVQGTLKSPLQHHSSKASIFQHSAFFVF